MQTFSTFWPDCFLWLGHSYLQTLSMHSGGSGGFGRFLWVVSLMCIVQWLIVPELSENGIRNGGNGIGIYYNKTFISKNKRVES